MGPSFVITENSGPKKERKNNREKEKERRGNERKL
jgi:hypothetical protein